MDYRHKLKGPACISVLPGLSGTATFSGLSAAFGRVIFLNILATNAAGAQIANITRQVRLGKPIELVFTSGHVILL